MLEYKVLAISQWWTNKGFAEKATRKLNSHVLEGWKVLRLQHGWNGFLVSTLYVVLERESGAPSADRS